MSIRDDVHRLVDQLDEAALPDAARQLVELTQRSRANATEDDVDAAVTELRRTPGRWLRLRTPTTFTTTPAYGCWPPPGLRCASQAGCSPRSATSSNANKAPTPKRCS